MIQNIVIQMLVDLSAPAPLLAGADGVTDVLLREGSERAAFII
jgi:hypothetical protein